MAEVQPTLLAPAPPLAPNSPVCSQKQRQSNCMSMHSTSRGVVPKKRAEAHADDQAAKRGTCKFRRVSRGRDLGLLVVASAAAAFC
jgi:hypothetical protein